MLTFLDLKKAFDSLDHCILLTQLSSLGLSNLVLRWFQDYPSNRTYLVKSSKKFSPWVQMKAGIPQGSALGPLLLLIYVNILLSTVLDGLLLQYAGDDTTLVCSGPTPEAAANVMNQQLSCIHD